MGCKAWWENLRAGVRTKQGVFNLLHLGVMTGTITFVAMQCAENDEMVGVSAATLALEAASELLTGILIFAGKKIQKTTIGACLGWMSAGATIGAFWTKAYATKFRQDELSELEQAALLATVVSVPTSIMSAAFSCFSRSRGDANIVAAQQARAAAPGAPAAAPLINQAAAWRIDPAAVEEEEGQHKSVHNLC